MLNLAIILTFLLGTDMAYRGSDLMDYYDTFFGDYIIRHVRNDMPSCDDEKLMTMLANIQIVNPENIVDLAVEHLPSICQKLGSNIITMEDYLRTCQPSHQAELYVSLIKGVKRLSQILCKDGKLKPLYKNASDCIQKLDYKVCQGPPDWNENSDNEKICQAYLNIIKCYKETTDESCGEKAGIVTQRIIKGVVSSVLPVLCEAINADISHDYNDLEKPEDSETSESSEDLESESKKDKTDKTTRKSVGESSHSATKGVDSHDTRETTTTKKKTSENAKLSSEPDEPVGPKSMEKGDSSEETHQSSDSKDASLNDRNFQSRNQEAKNPSGQDEEYEGANKDDKKSEDQDSGIETNAKDSEGSQHKEEPKNEEPNVRDDQEPLEDVEDDDLVSTETAKLVSNETEVESGNETQFRVSGRFVILLELLWLIRILNE